MSGQVRAHHAVIMHPAARSPPPPGTAACAPAPRAAQPTDSPSLAPHRSAAAGASACRSASSTPPPLLSPRNGAPRNAPVSVLNSQTTDR
eukprot:COSAG01_NODE_5851_length_3993_cov_9.227273_2_plen_90_part_00